MTFCVKEDLQFLCIKKVIPLLKPYQKKTIFTLKIVFDF